VTVLPLVLAGFHIHLGLTTVQTRLQDFKKLKNLNGFQCDECSFFVSDQNSIQTCMIGVYFNSLIYHFSCSFFSFGNIERKKETEWTYSRMKIPYLQL
jgi:hypothetical protein